MAESTATRPPQNGSGQSLGDLVSLAVKDLLRLVKCELDLAKMELRADARRVALAGALLAIAVFAGCLVLNVLCFALAYGLIAVGIWAWAAFLIVAGVLVLFAAIAILLVYVKVRRLTGLRKTRETVAEDLALLRRDEQASLPPASETG
jgi:uncharacterized membrane protein YqjE